MLPYAGVLRCKLIVRYWSTVLENITWCWHFECSVQTQTVLHMLGVHGGGFKQEIAWLRHISVFMMHISGLTLFLNQLLDHVSPKKISRLF